MIHTFEVDEIEYKGKITEQDRGYLFVSIPVCDSTGLLGYTNTFVYDDTSEGFRQFLLRLGVSVFHERQCNNAFLKEVKRLWNKQHMTDIRNSFRKKSLRR